MHLFSKRKNGPSDSNACAVSSLLRSARIIHRHAMCAERQIKGNLAIQPAMFADCVIKWAISESPKVASVSK